MTITGISNSLLSFVKDLILKIIYALLTPFANLFYSSFTTLNINYDLIDSFFDILARYINYIIDLSMIYPFVWHLLISSILTRVFMSLSVIFVKIIVHWWHFLVP